MREDRTKDKIDERDYIENPDINRVIFNMFSGRGSLDIFGIRSSEMGQGLDLSEYRKVFLKYELFTKE